MRTLGAETFEKIKKLKFTPVGVSGLIDIFKTGDEEEARTR